jgi:hypothetical protein
MKKIIFRCFYKKLQPVSVVPAKAVSQVKDLSNFIKDIFLDYNLTFLIIWNFILCLDPALRSGMALAGMCFS